MEQLLYFGFLASVPVPITILFCRHQKAHRKPVSFWTICFGALIATLISFVCEFAPDIFTHRFWNYILDNTYFGPIIFFLFFAGIPLLISFLSASLVVNYYRSRNIYVAAVVLGILAAVAAIIYFA